MFIKYIIIVSLILAIIYLIKSRRKIEIQTFTRPIFLFISLALLLILVLIVKKHSNSLIDYLIVGLISILFYLNLRLQGLSSSGVYVIKGSPILSQFISYKDIKNIEIVNKKFYFTLQIIAFGSYFNLDFKKEDENRVKNIIGKY